MADREIQSRPVEVDAQGGAVTVHCPDTSAIRMTPDAAEETAERLVEGAMKARGQLYFANEGRD